MFGLDVYDVYITVYYAWSQCTCLAIDLLLILIVDGISKNILSEIRSQSAHIICHL